MPRLYVWRWYAAPAIAPNVSVGASGALLVLALHKGKDTQVDLKRVAQVVALNLGMGLAADGKSLYTLTEREMEQPSSILTRFDLSRTLDVTAAVEQHGEVFCEPATQIAATGSPLQRY